MNSCDFSRFHYSYAEVEGDLERKHFNMNKTMNNSCSP